MTKKSYCNAGIQPQETAPLFNVLLSPHGVALIKNTKTSVISLLSEDGNITDMPWDFRSSTWVQSWGVDLEMTADSIADIIESVGLHRTRKNVSRHILHFINGNIDNLREKSGILVEEGLRDPEVADWIAEKFGSTSYLVAISAERSLPLARELRLGKLEQILRLFIENREQMPNNGVK